MKQIKKLIEHIRIDWNALQDASQDEKEIKIIRNCGQGRKKIYVRICG